MSAAEVPMADYLASLAPSPQTAASWQPVDLAPIVAGIEAGDVVGPVPRLMLRTDGVPLLYPGGVHSVSAEPEAGKSWIGLAEGAHQLRQGEPVLYLDFEDTPAGIVTRLLALGAPAAAIVERFTYVHPEHALDRDTLDTLITGRAYTLAVLDGMSEAYALLGLDPYANQDVPKFLQTLARPIASNTGAAVLLIDHVVKDKESRGRYALGAQHKLAGVLVAYGLDVVTPPSRRTAGLSKLTVHKDRPGHVRGHAVDGVVALVRIEPENNGDVVTVRLDPPDSVAETGTFRPTVLMDRVSRFVAAHPGATKRDVRDGVSGNSRAKDTALDVLIAEQWIRVEPDGRAQRHHVAEDFAEDTTCPRDRTVPERAQGTLVPQRAHVPHPYKGAQGNGAHRDPANQPTVPMSALTADMHTDGGSAGRPRDADGAASRDGHGSEDGHGLAGDRT